MNLDEVLRKKIADAVANNRVATRENLLSNYKFEFVVSGGWQGYANPRVTLAIDGLSEAEVSYLKFFPLPEEGIVTIMPARKDEPGATEFSRGDSRNTGSVSMRVALNDFDLDWSAERKLKLPVREDTVQVGEADVKVLIMRVKRPASKLRQQRGAKRAPDAPESPTNDAD